LNRYTNQGLQNKDLDKTELFNAIKEMRNKRNAKPNINK